MSAVFHNKSSLICAEVNVCMGPPLRCSMPGALCLDLGFVFFSLMQLKWDKIQQTLGLNGESLGFYLKYFYVEVWVSHANR